LLKVKRYELSAVSFFFKSKCNIFVQIFKIMRKLVLIFLPFMLCSIFLMACRDTVTYAEQLEEEQDAIDALIKDSGIVVLTQSEFYAKDSVTNVSRNEYVQLGSGVYMQIVNRGSTNPVDTFRSNDEVLVRFTEYNIMDSMSVVCSNAAQPGTVDVFRYTVSGTSISGIFLSGVMYANYQSSTVPSGWLTVFPYIRDGAHVKLIVPSKMGHNTSAQYVRPYFYDLTKIQIYR